MNKIIFIGTNLFATYILNKLLKNKKSIIHVITKPDAKIGRGRKLTPYPVKILAIKNNITIYTPKIFNTQNTFNFIKNLKPNLIIVIEYGEKIESNIIKLKNTKIINIHPSILPKFKGASPIYHAIIKGEKETGVSIIKLNNKLDSGDIININRCKIQPFDDYISLSKRLYKLSHKCLIQTIYMLEKKIAKFTQQDTKKTVYAKKIDKTMLNINWHDTANNINKKIKALSQKPHAHTTIKNNHIKIITSTIINKRFDKNLIPGTIINISKLGLDIITTKNLLRIKKIQFSNKNPLRIIDILNSKKSLFTLGNKFE